MNLNNIFAEIIKDLDELDTVREGILKLSREMVRNCSEIIKSLHRKDYEDFKIKIKMIKEQHIQLRKLINKNPLYFSKYLWTPEQEFTEAVLFEAVLLNKDFPSSRDLNLEPLSYILGMADLIGEMNRMCLNMIREGKISKLNHYFEIMELIYDNLFNLDYPKGILKNLRSKIDGVRKTLENLRRNISLSIQMDRLNSSLKEKELKKKEK